MPPGRSPRPSSAACNEFEPVGWGGAAPDGWRRVAGFILDGLHSDAATFTEEGLARDGPVRKFQQQLLVRLAHGLWSADGAVHVDGGPIPVVGVMWQVSVRLQALSSTWYAQSMPAGG